MLCCKCLVDCLSVIRKEQSILREWPHLIEVSIHSFICISSMEAVSLPFSFHPILIMFQLFSPHTWVHLIFTTSAVFRHNLLEMSFSTILSHVLRLPYYASFESLNLSVFHSFTFTWLSESVNIHFHYFHCLLIVFIVALVW